MSLGFIVKSAVNNFVPPLTGTDVSMESCFINPFTGTLSIKNFIVGTPKGFKADNTFALKEVYVDIALLSLTSDKIIIEKILVDGMDVTFETSLTGTNVGAIKHSVDKATKKEDAKTEEVKKEPKEAQESDGEMPKDDSKGKGLQIDDFKFINSHVTFAAGGTGGAVSIPDIVMTGIGADSKDGASATEVFSQVMNKLYIAILKSAQNVNSDTWSKSADSAVESVKEGTDSLVKGVKNLFGDDEK